MAVAVAVVFSLFAYSISAAAAASSSSSDERAIVQPYDRVIVQGKVVCQDCQQSLSGSGSTIITSQAPVEGAFVSVQCYSEAKQEMEQQVGRSGRQGIYSIELKGSTATELKNCKVTLLSSPTPQCNVNKPTVTGIEGSTPAHFKPTKLVFLTGPLVVKPYYC